jgi:putative FmdB family regulatory protein
MPTYTYACNSCGNRFDIFQKFSDEPVRDCPDCGEPVRKVFHASGIVFKGSGWYINDSRGKSSGDSSSPATTDAKSTSGDSATEVKTETKTETKTESTTSSADTKAPSSKEAAA